jgi:tRNA (guanine37-N1)-methyltransferase
MKFKILTIFPNLFPGPLGASITGLALEKKLWSLETIDIRSYSKDKHQSVDDYPYGGGAGMVLKPDVIADAIDANKCKKIIYLSPRGKVLNQKMAQELAKEKELMILCGRYEGVDQRVLDEYEIEEVSIGDYVLSGGEIAAYVFIDVILRNIDGVLGADESLNEESFGAKNNPEYENLLEYPHYTRPAIWREKSVPEILTQGHHKKIQEWRKNEAINITKKNRPDLLFKK